MTKPGCRTRRRGIMLTEMVMVILLLILVTGLLIQVLRSGGNVMRAGVRTTETMREADIILTAISADLRQARGVKTSTEGNTSVLLVQRADGRRLSYTLKEQTLQRIRPDDASLQHTFPGAVAGLTVAPVEGAERTYAVELLMAPPPDTSLLPAPFVTAVHVRTEEQDEP